jgi:peptidoglycan/xylan/chitin deacetylase (PgdA/CDA1 family)
MKKRFIFALILVGVACLIGIIYALFIHKELVVKTFDKEISILVHNEYNDPEINICYGTIIKCKKLELEKKGEVDTSLLGDYILEYKFKTDNRYDKLERIVHVYDDVKPEITVNGDITVCKDKKIVDGEYKATDNYDGDITNKVIFIDKDDVETQSYLEVKDSSDNISKINVEAKLYDGEPSLTLKGNTSDTIIKGNKYSEPGFTATDKCDGDITKDITINGSVKTDTVGTYTITYEVTNSIGKKVSKTRTVKVINRQVVTNVPASGKKIIYLTFDDGPSAYTSKLLNILDKYGIKATFFVTGNNINLISQEKSRGHTVCIHTYSHDYSKIYKSVDAYFADLNKMNNIIKQKTGSTVNCLRFPGGSSNTVSRKYNKGIMTTLTGEVTRRGYRYYDWNISSGDAGQTTSSRGVYNNVVKYLKGGVYNVLMHDSKSYTVNAVEDIIKYGLANGYTFLPITASSPTFHHGVNN